MRRGRSVDWLASRGGLRALGLVATACVAWLVVGALIGTRMLLDPASGVVGSNPSFDFQIMTWSLAWWPWAFAHGVDPLHTGLLWAPSGFSVLWMTSIPVPALLALPITLLAGPLVAYNVLTVAAVVLAAVGAYLLCHELTDKASASIVGGLAFGLSPYLLGHTLSEHLNLTFVFPVPLIALLAVRCARGRTAARRYIALVAVLLLALAGSSLELFVDFTVVAALVGALGLLAAQARRRTLWRVASLTAVAYAASFLVLVPIAIFAYLAPHAPIQNQPAAYETDLLNTIVPTPTILLGSFHWARTISSHFVGNIGEQDGYIGIPLLVISGLALRKGWRRGAWLAGLLVLVAFVLSLGSVVTADGRPLLVLPFSASSLPVLAAALPARLAVFAALGVSCLASLWFASTRRIATRAGAGALITVSLLPNFWPATRSGSWARSFRWSTATVPLGFVKDPNWKRVVPPRANVLVVPTADRTAATYWQVRSGMRFELAMPETPFVPLALAGSPTVARLTENVLLALDGRRLTAARLRAFLLADDVRALVITPRAGASWVAIAQSATSSRPLNVNGSELFRVPKELKPLQCTGELTVAKLPTNVRRSLEIDHSRASIRAWLQFDGSRAHVRVRYAGRVTMLSAPAGDAESPAVALNRSGHASVTFTEWRGDELLLRVATYNGSRWHIATLDHSQLPIWSQRVAVEPNGTTVAAWIAELGPERSLRAAALKNGGRWGRPLELDRGSGLGALVLRASRSDLTAAAWQDSLARETHVRAAIYDGGRWYGPQTLSTGLHRIDRVILNGARVGTVEWRSWTADLPSWFEARRSGRTWAVAHQFWPPSRHQRGPI